jgi:uncharacterized lipoprotein YajG
MHTYRANRHIASLALGATLAVSAVALTACSQQPTTVQVSEPDRHWDDHENQAWHRFLTEKNRPDHEYAKTDRNEQSEYQAWRHNHPD